MRLAPKRQKMQAMFLFLFEVVGEVNMYASVSGSVVVSVM